MNRAIVRGALILFVVAVSRPAWGQGVFDLEYLEIENMGSNPFPMVSQQLSKSQEVPASLPSVLSGKTVFSFTARAAGGRVPLVMTGHRKSPLYVDLDGDGDFSDERPILGRDLNSRRQYGPVVLPVAGSNGRLAARFSVYALMEQDGPFSVTLFLAGYRTGQVQLGGATYRVALVDANFDGRCNQACSDFDGDYGKIGADCFAIDLDQNGHFDRFKEFSPLTKVVRVRGTCYSLAVLPDGSKVRLRQIEPRFELGQLDVESPDAELVLFSADLGLLTLGGSRGKWKLPAGEYTLIHAKLARAGEHGVKWELRRRWSAGQRPSYMITEGEVLRDRVGAPLRVEASMSSKTSRGTVSIGFKLVGQGGEEYEDAAERNGHKLGPPKLKIFDERGKVLATGSFEYG